MTQVAIAAGANASLTRGIAPPLDISPFARTVAAIPGLVHFLDPETAPVLTGGVSLPRIIDRANGRPLIASPTSAPVLAIEPGVANGRPLFDVTGTADCTLTSLDATVTPSFTFVTLWRPLGHALDATLTAYLLRATAAGIGKLGLLSTAGTPQLLLTDEALGWGLVMPFSGHVSLSIPVVIGISVDQASKRAAIYVDSGNAAAASTTVSSVASYPSARWTFFGSETIGAGGISRFGRTVVYNRALADGADSELAALIAMFRTYYGF